jgi:hypothetical protein
MLLLMLVLGLPAAGAMQSPDPHALFELKCGRCHGHAGAFARDKLMIDQGDVVGRRSGKRVTDTLAHHVGKVSDAEAALIEDMFRRQILSEGIYAEKCRICHDPARDLARHRLALLDGRLVGRYDGRPVERFLRYHGRLNDDERAMILDMLAWQLATAGADPSRVPAARYDESDRM